MADSPVRSTSPVPGFTGFPGRSPRDEKAPSHRREEAPPAAAGDRVSVREGAAPALRLLRERVLARTRTAFGLGESVAVPHFAEVLDGEPLPAFLGRLLSAQNQLAACRAPAWPPDRVRAATAEALRVGAEETIDLLLADGPDAGGAVATVVEVLAHFGRRLAAAVAVP